MAGGKSKASAKKDDSNVNLEHGSLVIAKIPGYGQWPACVVDKQHTPDAVVKSCPKNKPVIVSCFGNPSHLTPLDEAGIDKYLADSAKSKGKDKKLIAAYEASKEYKSWLEETDEVVRLEKEAAENEDQLDEDDEAEAAPAPKKKKEKKEKEPKAADGKKRKREDGEKSANGQAKGEKKNEKKSKDTDSKKQKTDKPGSSSKAAANDDDDDGESLDPDTIKVKNWRHKLQRAFLGKDGTLKAEDMEANDGVFKTVEAFPMTVEQLRSSKIGKVMKRIVTLPGEIPRDQDFNFRKRAEALVNKWSNTLSSNGGNDAGDESKANAGDMTVGDITMDDKQEAPSQDKAVSPAKSDPANNNQAKSDPSANGEDKSQEAATTSSAGGPKQDE